ncbi:hypothetical protein KIP69_04940 [Geobacter sulfurreducens]|uniref:hypothetical protein n=1 Tax=Geobacter sulfurreducens TaxID=35554 RepID=UPI001BDCB843|nr:hypothetical protein [Geobacter sulfurreducens]QVW36203.1 hypothetical protein KIP69_04940 [Geobacter sulfurreducens]
MNDPVIEILLKLKGIKWVAYLIVLVLVVVGVANFTDALRKIYSFGKDILAHYQQRTLTDKDLKTDAVALSKSLMQLVIERQNNEPQIDFKNWDVYTNAQIRYSTETQNIFFRDYSAKVAHLRDEFAKRGLKDKNLDMFYQHPTNYIGLRELSTSIATLSEKI